MDKRILTISIFGVLATIAIATAGFLWAAELPAPQKNGDLMKELATMAGVLGDSLAQNDLAPHHGKLGDGPMAPMPGPMMGKMMGPMGSPVRFEYIPTVGAVFTIPVGFALADHPAPPDGAPGMKGAGDDEKDLWEKHSHMRTAPQAMRDRMRGAWRGNGTADLGDEIGNAVEEALDQVREHLEGLGGDVETEVSEALKGADFGIAVAGNRIDSEVGPELDRARHHVHREFEEGRISQEELDRAMEGIDQADHAIRESVPRALAAVGPAIHAAVPMIVRAANDPFRGDRRIRPAALEPYSQEKVEKLRRVLIETVAKYGNHLQHLGDSERILLIAEAPGGPMGKRMMMSGNKEDIARLDKMKAEKQAKEKEADSKIAADKDGKAKDSAEADKDKDKDKEKNKDKEKERREERRIVIRRGPGGPMVMAGFGPGMMGPIDHYLISIKKSDVAKETTFDDLTSKVTEQRY